MDRVIKERSHALLAHRGRRTRASVRLGRKRIPKKLPSSLGLSGLVSVRGKSGAKSQGCQLKAALAWRSLTG
jgi:hypothetical protein